MGGIVVLASSNLLSMDEGYQNSRMAGIYEIAFSIHCGQAIDHMKHEKILALECALSEVQRWKPRVILHFVQREKQIGDYGVIFSRTNPYVLWSFDEVPSFTIVC